LAAAVADLKALLADRIAAWVAVVEGKAQAESRSARAEGESRRLLGEVEQLRTQLAAAQAARRPVVAVAPAVTTERR
jgi:hypothetical protein